jgi:hypothetical protein
LASVGAKVPKPDRLSVGYLSWSGDSAEFLGKSYSPITSLLFNACPTVRFLPAGILMLGLLPPKTKKTKVRILYEAIIRRMRFDGAFEGFEIYDAFKKCNRTYRLEFTWIVEDLKGLPFALCCKTTGAKCGGCPWCDVCGFSLAGSTRYFTGILFIPMDSPARKHFEAEFSEHRGTVRIVFCSFIRTLYCTLFRTYFRAFILHRTEVKKLSKQTRPCLRTTKQCAASGRRANGVSHEDEPYYDIDVFTRSFSLAFDVTAKSGYDMAHGMGNNTADVFHLVLNTGQILKLNL